MPLPNSSDFYGLPRPVQERFAAAAHGTAPPPPLLFDPAARGAAWAMLGGSGGLVLVAALVLAVGVGDVRSSVALHGPVMLLLDAVLFGAAAYAAVHALALLRRLDALPFRAGRYLFPGCVVDAQGPILRVWSAAEVESTYRASAPALALVLRFRDGSEMPLPARNAEELERAESALTSLRPELLRGIAEDDPSALAEMDPLHDTAVSSPVGPTQAMKLALPFWVRFDWAIAAGLGVVLGLALGTTRNDFSDEAMFRAASVAGTVEAFRAYLDHGSRYVADVREVLLPRAELREAEVGATVESLRAFAQAHASSRIQPEIDAAIRNVLLVRLAEAKRVGTVSALDAFVKKYPDSKLDAEVQAARHALFTSALDAWQQKAHPDASTAAFFKRLLAWAEKNGPECEIRFRLTRSTIDEADAAAILDRHYPGPDALPSNYITAGAMHPREERVAAGMAKGFADAFAADVLSLKVGAPVGEGEAVPESKVPLMLVDYVAEWSHGNAFSTKPTTVFAGINFAFDTTFSLPDGRNPYEVKAKVFRGAEPWKFNSDGLSRVEFQQKVYDGIIDAAFDQLEKKLTGAMF